MVFNKFNHESCRQMLIFVPNKSWNRQYLDILYYQIDE